MSEADRITDLLVAAAERVGPLAAPDAVVRDVAKRAHGRRRARRMAAAATVTAIAVITAISVLVVHRSSAQRVIADLPSAINGTATAAQLAGYRWSALPTPPVSTALMGQTAVWAGRDLVVWGGGTSGSSTQDSNRGAMFDPAADRWQIMSPSPLSGRTDTAVVWTGSHLLFIGGQLSGADTLPAPGDASFDPTTNRWTLLPTRPASLDRTLRAVWTGTEALVVAADGHAASYSPARRRWQTLPAIPEPGRYLFDAYPVWTGRQTLVWVEEQQRIESGTNLQIDSGIDLWTIRPGARSWARQTTIGPNPIGLNNPAWTGSEVILPSALAFFEGPPRVGDNLIYNPTSHSYRSIPSDRYEPGDGDAVWTGAAEIAVVPKTTSPNTGVVESWQMAAWDPPTNTWMPLPAPPDADLGQLIWTGTELVAVGKNHIYAFAPPVTPPTPAAADPLAAVRAAATARAEQRANLTAVSRVQAKRLDYGDFQADSGLTTQNDAPSAIGWSTEVWAVAVAGDFPGLSGPAVTSAVYIFNENATTLLATYRSGDPWPIWFDGAHDDSQPGPTCTFTQEGPYRAGPRRAGRLTETRTFEYDRIRLDPPPPDAHPSASAPAADASALGEVDVVLALYRDTDRNVQPFLAWVIVAQQEPEPWLGPPNQPPHPPCSWDLVISPDNAITGVGMGITGFSGGTGFSLPLAPLNK